MQTVLLTLSLWLSAAWCLAAGDPFASASPAGALAASGEPKFLPVAQAYPTTVAVDNEALLVQWDITDGYYLYKERLQLKAAGPLGALALDVNLPAGEPHEDEFFGKTEVYRGTTSLRIPLPDSRDWTLELRSQGCADAGLCYPPRKQFFDIFADTGSVVETGEPLFTVTPPQTVPGDAVRQTALAPDTAEADTSASAAAGFAPAADESLLYMVLLAVLGGVILNLMPCVFPVLSLKVLKLTNTHDGSSRWLHCLAYSAGVVISFLVVAGALLSLRSAGAAIGWGFHLQSPVFVAALAYLFLAMGLGLSGTVNLGAGLMGVGGGMADQSGYLGSFSTGILATVVASPCTAPFMGTALGFAMTQPAFVSLMIFAALGIGLALPFVVFAMTPALMGLLPKPGAWMETFKQFLAFPLYAAAVWLLWVVGNQSGVNAMALVALGGVLLAMALWTLEGALRARRPLIRRAIALIIAALAIGLLGSPQLTPDLTEAGRSSAREENSYSPQRLQQLLDANEPVFVNLTADWCITCLANERVALSTQAVQKAFAERGVNYLKGDWTNADPEITALLTRYGRTGVPLYLVFGPGRDKALVLPQLLSANTVLDALDAAGIGAP